MCGDSTKESDVSILMNGNKADMVFTDPPYGVDYQSNMRTATPKFEVLKNDNKFITGWRTVLANRIIMVLFLFGLHGRY